MTIVEFLTARLDELESIAHRAVSDVASAEIDNYGRLTFPAYRLLADIAAKRAIIERCAYGLGDYHQDGIAWDIFAQLASVYVDHPDYQQEWMAKGSGYQVEVVD